MKVLKFGGTSVKNAENILKVIAIVGDELKKGEEVVVVCSAHGGITDLLIEMSAMAARGDAGYVDILEQFKTRHNFIARTLLTGERYVKTMEDMAENHEVLEDLLKGIFLVREASPRTMDYVLSFGERNSNYIIAKAFMDRGIEAHYLDARNILVTNKDFGKAQVDFDLTEEKVKSYFSTHSGLHIVTGFIAKDKGGLTTTLGRGGSDYTASILAAALDADVLEIWTDVNGVLTCDPRKVKGAFTLSRLSYREAMEMSHFGAKVIYPPTISPVMAKGIPLYIKNTFDPGHPGTRIHTSTDTSSGTTIKGISTMSDIAVLNIEGSGMAGIPGVSARLFSCLAAKDINVILITQASSEQSITFVTSGKDAKNAKNAVEKEFERYISSHKIKPVTMRTDQCIVAVVGEGMASLPGVAADVFGGLGKNGINVSVIAQGSSELNISLVIDKKDQSKALNVIHETFFSSDAKQVNVFSIGVGLIGSTFLSQVAGQYEYLRENMDIDLRVIGLSNSKRMFFSEEGIDLRTWKDALANSDQKSDIKDFISTMIGFNLPNTIFIDNTAGQAVPDYYESILQQGISIVTPNKVAASSNFETYQNLKHLAKKHHCQYLYETNVGAGLPVISTLQSLIESGDEIISIQGVLSGSLSYIFNNFTSEVSFAELVKSAREQGYTEPDPRDDLSGKDVARKILIMAREIGIAMEISDVEISPILPTDCMQASSIDVFFESLKNHEDYFLGMVKKAEGQGKRLRYIAKVESGKAKIGLVAIDEESPFYGLSGSDNMIVFKTKRYHTNPLVIKGPGAGASVTAGGVFADVIKIIKN